MAFRLFQQQQALLSTCIQMHQQIFERDMHVISSINVDMLTQAQQEEENRILISNPAVRLLQKHVHASSG